MQLITTSESKTKSSLGLWSVDFSDTDGIIRWSSTKTNEWCEYSVLAN